uniref:Uncharacterized protein n=1 Tax=Arundo donax TaxID=35708 RepID=A0A0A8YM88_ARUDO
MNIDIARALPTAQSAETAWLQMRLESSLGFKRDEKELEE